MPKKIYKRIIPSKKDIKKTIKYTRNIPKTLKSGGKTVSKKITSTIDRKHISDTIKYTRKTLRSGTKGVSKTIGYTKDVSKKTIGYTAKTLESAFDNLPLPDMEELIKFFKIQIPKLNYGIIHSQVGFSDGVSIVMEQIEGVMVEDMKIPKSNIHYLVGAAKNPSPRIRQCGLLWHKYPVNRMMINHFSDGYGGSRSEKIEKEINLAKEEIKKFIDDKKIDVLIVHNSSHPVNFISSVAVSRYYRDEIKKHKKTPKYILWWHDSHFERKQFQNPTPDVKRYLLQGVPGRYVEYILFINSLQFELAHKYFLELDKKSHGFYDNILHNHDVIYNTTNIIISSLRDLQKSEFAKRTEQFLEEFKIKSLLNRHRLKLKDVLFCLQHTRIVPRKRIDFALEYSYELLSKLREKKSKKAMIFFVSGHSGAEPGNYKKKLIELNAKLSKKYKTNKFFLIFAEDYPNASVKFEKFPSIFARLGGIATYFSEIEGFGNNLLEVLSGGLIPVVYTYPVFIKDIAKYKFKVVCLDKFKITPESIEKIIEIIKKDKMRKNWAESNIKILKKKFPHRIIASKLKRAIIRHRAHI